MFTVLGGQIGLWVEPVRLSYQPYFFCQPIVFFSHDKSENNIFSHDFLVPRKIESHFAKDTKTSVGYHKKGYPNQSNKNHKRQNKPPIITRARAPSRLAPWARDQTTAHPTPLASGASSASPDPSRARAPEPFRLIPHYGARLPTYGARTHDVTGAVTPMSQQGMVATIPITLVTTALRLSLCNLISFAVVYCLTVKEEWGRLISVTICCLLSLLTGQAAVSPIRPPQRQQGSVTLHNSNHAISHASRTGWASFYRVGTVVSLLNRGNLRSLM